MKENSLSTESGSRKECEENPFPKEPERIIRSKNSGNITNLMIDGEEINTLLQNHVLKDRTDERSEEDRVILNSPDPASAGRVQQEVTG